MGGMTHILDKTKPSGASELLRCLFVLGLMVWNGNRSETQCLLFMEARFSHQFCIQAALAWENPASSAVPDAVASPAHPAGPPWSPPPTDVPSAASCTKRERRRSGFTLGTFTEGLWFHHLNSLFHESLCSWEHNDATPAIKAADLICQTSFRKVLHESHFAE